MSQIEEPTRLTGQSQTDDLAPHKQGFRTLIDWGSAMPWIVAIVFLFALPLVFGSGAGLTIMNQMAITIIFALSYNMLLGQGGMLSFGHAVYMGLGGFFCMHVLNWVENDGSAIAVAATAFARRILWFVLRLHHRQFLDPPRRNRFRDDFARRGRVDCRVFDHHRRVFRW